MILGLMMIFMGLGVILYGGYAVKLGIDFIKETIKGKKKDEETTDEVVDVVEDVEVEEEVKEAE
jgi:putative N-acetylmannosamine-6-phosphate epimerase